MGSNHEKWVVYGSAIPTLFTHDISAMKKPWLAFFYGDASAGFGFEFGLQHIHALLRHEGSLCRIQSSEREMVEMVDRDKKMKSPKKGGGHGAA